MSPRRRRDSRASLARAVASASASVFGACRWSGCHMPVLWLAHVRTRRVACIDRDPTDDGSIRVLRDEAGNPSGLYVVAPVAARSGLVGQLHTVHVASCGNATARRLARDRQRDLDAAIAAPAAVPCADPACVYPLPDVDLVAGERFHATCDPRFKARSAVRSWSRSA